MVHVYRRFSLSLLLSLATVFSISAMETRSLDDIDMTDATLEFLPGMVRTDGIEEKTNLFYDQEGFFVRTSGDDVRVHKYDTDKCLLGLSTKDIAKRALLGKFKVSKLDNGEYVVRSHGELKGGGPVLAGLFYWATKVGLYGAFAGAVAGDVCPKHTPETPRTLTIVNTRMILIMTALFLCCPVPLPPVCRGLRAPGRLSPNCRTPAVSP